MFEECDFQDHSKEDFLILARCSERLANLCAILSFFTSNRKLIQNEKQPPHKWKTHT
jgi:hypothetical protein